MPSASPSVLIWVIIQRSCWGVYWFHSVRPSVRPSRVRPASRVRSVASTVLVGSISYLCINKATSKGVSRAKYLAKFWNLKFWQFFKICNFDFVLFWLGIWCESLVWVIMGRRRVSQNADVLVVLVTFNRTFAIRSVKRTYIFWPSIPPKRFI